LSVVFETPERPLTGNGEEKVVILFFVGGRKIVE
jgi:hypothetical protein